MDDLNQTIRAAAGLAIQKIVRDKGTNVLTWREIDQGFVVDGKKIHFATKAAGIFKPESLTDGAALSIKQVKPSRAGRVAPYDDAELGEGSVVYKLQRNSSKPQFNKSLQAAYLGRVPLIFFRGLADGLYEVFYPVFIEDFSYATEEAIIGFDAPEGDAQAEDNRLGDSIPVRYRYGDRKARLHQKAFRERVLLAYGLRCALTNLPLIDLLEAAHIVSDSKGGEASVRNGIAMSTFHHRAYESNLLGIDPDGRIHLNEKLSETRDGPMFEYGMLQLSGRQIRLPKFEAHQPSRDFLALKFEDFRRQQT